MLEMLLKLNMFSIYYYCMPESVNFCTVYFYNLDVFFMDQGELRNGAINSKLILIFTPKNRNFS